MRERSTRTRVAVVFGGRSGEHDVSCHSAESVLANLDRDRYEVVPVRISRDGIWLVGQDSDELLSAPGESTGAATSVDSSVKSPPLCPRG